MSVDVVISIASKSITLPDYQYVPVLNMTSSPVIDQLQQLIHIDKKAAKPIYIQLTEQIAAAINNGLLKEQSQLPGTRQLATLLTIHRKTIIAAYEELTQQGMVVSLANKGTFVNQKNRSNIPTDNTKLADLPKESSLYISVNRILDLETTAIKSDYQLDDGESDIRTFQLKSLNIGIHPILNHLKIDNAFLLFQIQQYVLELHRLKITNQQVVITSNRALSLFSITQTLLEKGDTAIVGMPGHYLANMLIQQAEGNVKTVNIHQEGWDLDQLEDHCKKGNVRLVYVSPAHQYPATFIMEYHQRLSLLRLAERYSFFIIEDNTDAFFSYQKWQLPSLLSLDTLGCVLHIGSFEQLIPHDYSLAYILGPQNILSEIRKFQLAIGLDNRDFIPKKVIAAGLQSGGILQLHKKNTRLYAKRMDHTANMLIQEWGQYVHFELPKNGLAFWLQFDWDFKLTKFASLCRSEGLSIPSKLLYQSKNQTAMRLGFGKWEDKEWEKIIDIGRNVLVRQ